MTSTNISLRKEAYEFLKRLKTKDKSFSDIIMEFREFGHKKGSNEIVLDFIENESLNIDWRNKEKDLKEARKEFEDELDKRILKNKEELQ